jgi:hypothetical protein
MHENSNKFSVFLAFNDLESFVDLFLLKHNVTVFLNLALLGMKLLFIFFQEGAESLLLLFIGFRRSHRKYREGEFLVIFL